MLIKTLPIINTKRSENSQIRHSFHNTLPKDTVEFKHKQISFGNKFKAPALSLEDFRAQLSTLKPQISQEQTRLSQIIKESVNASNLLGEGGNSRVYSIPGIPSYVIKVFKKVGAIDNLKVKAIVPKEDKLPEKNLGQAIGEILNDNGGDILILKRQSGEEHSAKNWSAVVNRKIELTEADSQKFLKDVKKLAEMPDSTYDEMAATIVNLEQKGFKTDSINPNNLLIDYEHNSINVIDFFTASNPTHKNSYLDMVFPLLDIPLSDNHQKFWTKAQKDEYTEASKIVVEKCLKAAQKTGLSTNEQTFLDFLTEVDTFFGIPGNSHRQRYAQFKDFIGMH